MKAMVSERHIRVPTDSKTQAPLASGFRAYDNDQAGHQISAQDGETKEQGQGAINSLACLHRSWGVPSDRLIQKLLDCGVSEQAMVRPWCLGGGNVRYHGRSFQPDRGGEAAITFRAEDLGEVTDLIAWDPSTGRLASLCGQAFCLGDLDEVVNPATYFGGEVLWVHETPLEWLLAERRGIVILRRELAPAYLAHAPRLACSTVEFAAQVRAWIQPPAPTAMFYVKATP